jgi:hypothetical protein
MSITSTTSLIDKAADHVRTALAQFDDLGFDQVALALMAHDISLRGPKSPTAAFALKVANLEIDDACTVVDYRHNRYAVQLKVGGSLDAPWPTEHREVTLSPSLAAFELAWCQRCLADVLDCQIADQAGLRLLSGRSSSGISL